MEYDKASTARGFLMPHDAPPPTKPLPTEPGERRTFDDALGRRIVDLHIWAAARHAA